MIGYIYLTTNLVNNKKYIGQHRSSSFDPSYLGSGTLFVKALKKYGSKNFSQEILCECETYEELDDKEIYYISLYDAVRRDDFYNVSLGGYKKGIRDLISMYNEQKDQIIYCLPDIVDTFISKGFRLGNRPRSEQSKINYSNSKKDLVVITNDIDVIYVHKDVVSDYLQQGYRVGRIATRPNQKEEKRKWMNKNGESVMVKHDEIDSYLSNGYSFGRTKFKQFNRTAPAHNKGKTRLVRNGKVTYESI